MTSTKVSQASKKANYLDSETQHLLNTVRKKNNKAVAWFVVSWSILLIIGITGIFYQNHLAAQNKQHIDCIIKLLATPAKPGQVRHIANLTTCGIKVS